MTYAEVDVSRQMQSWLRKDESDKRGLKRLGVFDKARGNDSGVSGLPRNA